MAKQAEAADAILIRRRRRDGHRLEGSVFPAGWAIKKPLAFPAFPLAAPPALG